MCILEPIAPSRPKEQPHRIFIVDDHLLILKGYRMMLDPEEDFIVCGEAASGEEALERIAECEPDLVITDIKMGGMSGLELTAYLNERWPDLVILVSSMYEKELYGRQAEKAGASGYVQKDELACHGVAVLRCLLSKKCCKNCPFVFGVKSEIC